MKNKFGNVFSMKASEKTAEITIYEEIGEGWYGGITAKDFVKQLAALGEVDTINVHINSPGGDVFDGLAMHNALVNHPATVNVHIDGLAASIASIIAMAGDTITIADNAMLMIHNPWSVAIGEAKDMRKMADTLDQIRGTLVGTYAKQTGMSEKDIIALLDAETWLDATQAKEKGFVDAIGEGKKAKASFDLSHFKNAPEKLPAASASEEFAEPEYYRRRLALVDRKVALHRHATA